MAYVAMGGTRGETDIVVIRLIAQLQHMKIIDFMGMPWSPNYLLLGVMNNQPHTIKSAVEAAAIELIHRDDLD